MNPEPWLSIPARLGWILEKRPRYGGESDPNPVSQTLQFRPALHGGLPLTGKYLDLTLDLLGLFESASKPGGYYLVTCQCGCPDDADIQAPIFVSHPDSQSVVWELDQMRLRSAWENEDWIPEEPGFLRLTFQREEYEADLRTMSAEARAANAELEVDYLEPGDAGTLGDLLALDSRYPIIREPIWPAGSELVFQFVGSELCWVNGKRYPWWPTRLFTRWEVYQAFQDWIRFVSRVFALDIPRLADSRDSAANDFILLDEANREVCNAAGEAFADVLRRAYGEGSTAPGVRVTHISM